MNNKTPEEIVQALRDYFDGRELKRGDALESADLIESLQAQLSEARLDRNAQKAFKNHYKAQLVESNHEIIQLKLEKEMMRQEWDDLQAQLAASQCREQAAVEDIEKMMRICEKGSCHFCADGDCTNSPYCEPKWRGPQEAWKGKSYE